MSGNENDSANKRTETKSETERKTKTNKQVRKRNRMEIALYIIGITATIIFGLAAYFVSFHTNLRTASVWLLFASLVLYSLGLCLYLQDRIWKENVVASQQSTQLLIENTQTIPEQPTPEKPTLQFPTFKEDIKECVFNFGGNPATYSIEELEKDKKQFLSVNGIAPVVYIKNHIFYADVTVSDPYKPLPVQIIEGELSVTPENWDFNSNTNAFEVVNEKLDVVFQLIYTKPSKIFLYGIFPDPQIKNQLIFVSENSIINAFSKPKDFSIKRHFKYPAWKYPGQFDDTKPEKTVPPTHRPEMLKSKK